MASSVCSRPESSKTWLLQYPKSAGGGLESTREASLQTDRSTAKQHLSACACASICIPNVNLDNYCAPTSYSSKRQTEPTAIVQIPNSSSSRGNHLSLPCIAISSSTSTSISLYPAATAQPSINQQHFLALLQRGLSLPALLLF